MFAFSELSFGPFQQSAFIEDLFPRIHFQGFTSSDFVDCLTSFGHTVSLLCSFTLMLDEGVEISAGSIKQRIITQHEIGAREVLVKSLKGCGGFIVWKITLA